MVLACTPGMMPIAKDLDPANADKTLTWIGSDTKIVAVSGSKIKDVGKGTAIIEVKPTSIGKPVYYFKVTVKKEKTVSFGGRNDPPGNTGFYSVGRIVFPAILSSRHFVAFLK